jgi:KUP system potassium uptake protein
MNAKHEDRRYLIGLVIGALGVVFGDIGTSPLYALRECFHGEHAIEPTRNNIFGVLSLIFWSLVIIVSVKYLIFVMRAHNNGEGGILALLALTFPSRATRDKRQAAVIAMGVFGAALLYGDGMITPAISVLSAVEGLNVATPFLEPFVIPITVAILIGLFSYQHHGTGKVGKVVGPLMALWFVSIAVLGIRGVLARPEVLLAVNPMHGVHFFLENRWAAFVVLGAVVLVVTGGEALYADMGHFGIRPIRLGWFAVVFPSLLLNYLGQGSLLLADPAAAQNPFYNLVPKWALYPMVLLATLAAVIASQALISGAYSLTMHAVHLGYLPRLLIKHTSSDEKGQIYLPQVNWMIMLACIGLVVGFRSSSNLAAAYGIAVTLTMMITTILFSFAARRLWNWPLWKAILLCTVFFLIELAFFGANALKITHGGWFPIVVGLAIYTLMSTWKTGRELLRQRLRTSLLPIREFLESIKKRPLTRVSGTAVFLAGSSEGTPLALLHNLKHNKVLHERVVLLTIVTKELPRVDPNERVRVETLDRGFYRVLGNYGFMDEPSIPEIIEGCKSKGIDIRPMETTFFLSRETIIATPRKGMAIWREKLFAIMSRNAQSATAYFRLPANRVVELGMQVEL